MLHLLTSIYICLLLIRPQEFVPALKGVPLMQILMLVCIGAWLFFRPKRVDLPQFPLLLWLLVAILLSRGMTGWWGGGLGASLGMIPIMMVFVLLTAAARELSHLRRLMAIIIASACVMVLHGHWQARDGTGWTGLPLVLNRITYAGIFSDPNDLGQLFVISIAFCIYFFASASFTIRVVLLSIVAWLGYGIYLTDSRGTMLAALAVFGFEGARRIGKVAMGALVVVAAGVLVVTTRFGQISTGEQSAADRIEAWYAGLQMLMSRPVFGVGVGNFVDIHGLTAHNFLMLPMAELGVFGFTAWLGLLWFTGLMLKWLLFREPRNDDSGAEEAESANERTAAYGLTAMCIGFVVSSFFLSQSYKHVLFVVIALVVARYIKVEERFGPAPTWPLIRNLAPLGAVSVGFIVFMWVTVRVLL